MKYNALTNNCADAVVETISLGTGVKISTTSNPKPNSVFKDISSNQAQTQNSINAKITQEQNGQLRQTDNYRGTHGGATTIDP